MLIVLLTTIHILVCVILIVVVLLQHGKSADIAATFGGVGSQTAFGPRGTATVLSRVTTWCAVIFMLTSIALTLTRGGRTGPASILQNEKPASSAPAPANPPAQKK